MCRSESPMTPIAKFLRTVNLKDSFTLLEDLRNLPFLLQLFKIRIKLKV